MRCFVETSLNVTMHNNIDRSRLLFYDTVETRVRGAGGVTAVIIYYYYH